MQIIRPTAAILSWAAMLAACWLIRDHFEYAMPAAFVALFLRMAPPHWKVSRYVNSDPFFGIFLACLVWDRTAHEHWPEWNVLLWQTGTVMVGVFALLRCLHHDWRRFRRSSSDGVAA